MVKLSVCIPYYETYDLTERLLKELILQKTDEVEIILVDDGCNEKRFDKYKEDIKVIHLETNGGVSKARNTAIKESTGKYLAFIDSDDMITMDYIDQLLNIINERDEDIITFNWLDITNNTIMIRPSNCSVWKSIYKKEIVPFFDETLRAREDWFFQKALESKMLRTYYFDRVLYMYYSGREGSLWWKETHK